MLYCVLSTEHLMYRCLFGLNPKSNQAWYIRPFVSWPYPAHLFSPTPQNQPNKNIPLPQITACSSLMSYWLSYCTLLCMICLKPGMPCGWWLWLQGSRLALGRVRGFSYSHLLWTQPAWGSIGQAVYGGLAPPLWGPRHSLIIAPVS